MVMLQLTCLLLNDYFVTIDFTNKDSKLKIRLKTILPNKEVDIFRKL